MRCADRRVQRCFATDMPKQRRECRETAPCDAMVTIVNQEWMRTGQEVLCSGRGVRAYGEAFEFVADCGSMLIGSPMMPYVEGRELGTGQAGCTADELASARHLRGCPRRTRFGWNERRVYVATRQDLLVRVARRTVDARVRALPVDWP